MARGVQTPSTNGWREMLTTASGRQLPDSSSCLRCGSAAAMDQGARLPGPLLPPTAQTAPKRMATRGTKRRAPPPPCRDGVPRAPGSPPPTSPLPPQGTNGEVYRQKQPPEPGIFLAKLRKCTSKKKSVKSALCTGNPAPHSRGVSGQHVARGSTGARPSLSRPPGLSPAARVQPPPQKLITGSMTNSFQRSRGS